MMRQNPIQIMGHSRSVIDFSFSNVTNDRVYYLISADQDGIAKLHFGHTGDWIGSFPKHKGTVYACAITRDGKRAATGSADYTVDLLNCESGAILCTLEHNSIVKTVDFSRDAAQSRLLTSTHKKEMKIFDLAATDSSTALLTLTGHTDAITKAKWFAHDQKIVSVSRDKTIKQWDVRSGTLIHSQTLSDQILDLDVSRRHGDATPTQNGETAGGEGDVNGEILLLTLPREVCVGVFPGGGDAGSHDIPMVRLPLSHSNETASASIHPSVTRQQITELIARSPTTTTATHSDKDDDKKTDDNANNFTFVCGGSDNIVYKCSLENGRDLECNKGHFGSIRCVRYSPDGHVYGSSSDDGTLRLWQNRVGEEYGLWYTEKSASTAATTAAATATSSSFSSISSASILTTSATSPTAVVAPPSINNTTNERVEVAPLEA